jgi:hypothetical protein
VGRYKLSKDFLKFKNSNLRYLLRFTTLKS